jgi:hypothetical protein
MELVILKFSHWDGFRIQNNWDDFTEVVRGSLDGLLYDGTMRKRGRLADTKLGTFIGSGKPCLALCDAPYPGATGMVPDNLWTYRNWDAPDAAAADLTVFDVWSQTDDFTTMWHGQAPDPSFAELPVGQLLKFDQFNGRCRDGTTVCDLFLWSWTLSVTGHTGPTDTPDACLGRYLATIGPNGGRIINLLYCDYVEYARGSDIALLRNGVWPP